MDIHPVQLVDYSDGIYLSYLNIVTLHMLNFPMDKFAASVFQKGQVENSRCIEHRLARKNLHLHRFQNLEGLEIPRHALDRF